MLTYLYFLTSTRSPLPQSMQKLNCVFILLGDKCTCVRTICPEQLCDSGIVIIHGFHGDTSLQQNFRVAASVTY